MTPLQLTLEGHEVEQESVATRRAGFTSAQREILRLVGERDITSSEAGRIVHAHRSLPCARCRDGSCGFAASDGSDALKRLQARGLVCRRARGVWSAAPPPAYTTDVFQTKQTPRNDRQELEQRLTEAKRHAQLASPHSAEGMRRRAAVERIEADLAALHEPHPRTAEAPR